MKQPVITVIGACNIDLISYIERMPEWGETLHGSKFHMGFGGKGANQAVMAAKLGAKVSMISKLGNDIFGDGTLKNLNDFGVDTKHVYTTDKAMSGVAPINVNAKGQNSIIIVTGANDLLTNAEIDDAEEKIAVSDVLVCQLEIPLAQNMYAMRLARKHHVPVIFNPAPARKDLPAELFPYCDIICPNEPEGEMITGMTINNTSDAMLAAQAIIAKGAKAVLMTLGSKGSLWLSHEESFVVEGKKVVAKDTTGAGDCFIGSFAFFYAQKRSVRECMEHANTIASISVQSAGTQTSFPDRKDLDEGIWS